MKNSDIVQVFSDIADLLEIKCENKFKTRAYHQAKGGGEYPAPDSGKSRGGWCEAKHILNTRPLEEVLAFLRR